MPSDDTPDVLWTVIEMELCPATLCVYVITQQSTLVSTMASSFGSVLCKFLPRRVDDAFRSQPKSRALVRLRGGRKMTAVTGCCGEGRMPCAGLVEGLSRRSVLARKGYLILESAPTKRPPVRKQVPSKHATRCLRECAWLVKR
jgi:hypothetical protein